MTHFKTRSAKIDKNSRFKQPGTIGIGKYLSEHTQDKICFVINTWTIIPRTVIQEDKKKKQTLIFFLCSWTNNPNHLKQNCHIV